MYHTDWVDGSACKTKIKLKRLFRSGGENELPIFITPTLGKSYGNKQTSLRIQPVIQTFLKYARHQDGKKPVLSVVVLVFYIFNMLFYVSISRVLNHCIQRVEARNNNLSLAAQSCLVVPF